MTLRLLSYNIRYGGAGHEAELAAVIRAAAADVVMLQEATNPLVVERLSKETGLAHWASRANHSTGFLSRIPVVHHEWHRPFGARHPFLEVVLAGDEERRIFGLHLSAYFSKWSERRRHREIRALLAGIRQHQHGFHLLAGDFNALAPGERLQIEQFPRWIKAMVWISGRDIARDTIQTMLDEHYVDAWRTLHPDEPGYSFPVWDPHVRLDYIFAPERYAQRLLSCEVVHEPAEVRQASDHHPLLVVVE